MKRGFLLCAAGLAVLLFAGCAPQESRMSYIGAESAKRAALEAASLSEQEVSAISTDMGTRGGVDYYQVCFEASGQKYQYDIDALTGVVISIQGPAADAGQSSRPEASSSQEAVSQPPASAEPAAAAPETDAYIGEDEALRIAREHAGLDAAQTASSRSKLDFEDGRWIYEVKFYSGDDKKYDYEIDAYTGAVISFDYDTEYHSPESDASGSGAITPEQAKQLALAQVPGASESNIREFKTDYDDGVLQYEGEIIYNGMEYEFEIDAYSGLIREWSAGPVNRS